MCDLTQIQLWIDEHVNDPRAKRLVFLIRCDQLAVVQAMLAQCGRPFVISNTSEPDGFRVAVN